MEINIVIIKISNVNHLKQIIDFTAVYFNDTGILLCQIEHLNIRLLVS